jgi:hypothetical protein
MIVVGSTMAAFAMSVEDHWASWLRNAEAVKESYPDVRYFAALQEDARGLEPFAPLLQRLEDVGGEYWTFSLDDGRTEVTTANRLIHITTGQNIVTSYAVKHRECSHLLFLAADCMPSDDIIPRMLEMDHPLCAPYISTYGLTGPIVEEYPYPVMDAMASAACIFIAREVFNVLRWRQDPVAGMSDDPSYHWDAKHLLGIDTHVRTDVEAHHFPMTIGAVETRGNDMRVVRRAL